MKQQYDFYGKAAAICSAGGSCQKLKAESGAHRLLFPGICRRQCAVVPVWHGSNLSIFFSPLLFTEIYTHTLLKQSCIPIFFFGCYTTESRSDVMIPISYQVLIPNRYRVTHIKYHTILSRIR